MVGKQRLPRSVWVLAGARAISGLGTGLTLPLTLIYLHQVRGISLAITGELFALAAVAGVVAMPLAGMALDRFGARPMYIAACVGQAMGAAGLAWAHNSATAAPAMILQGVGMSLSAPAMTTLMGGLYADTGQQRQAFGWNFTAVNAAIGIGAAIGGAVVNVRQVDTIQALFLANAASSVVCAALVARMPNYRHERGAKRPSAGYREVLASPALRTVLIVAFLLAFTGYATLDGAAPAFGVVVARVPARIIPLGLTVNTVIIVIGQPIALRLGRGMRSSLALVLIGLTWAVAWAILGLSALPASVTFRSALVLVFAATFAAGETLMAPTLGPLINRLAPGHLRGRANSLYQAAFGLSLVAVPVFSTELISAGVAWLLIGLLCAGSLCTVLLGLRLRRQVTAAMDRGTSEVKAAPGASALEASAPEAGTPDGAVAEGAVAEAVSSEAGLTGNSGSAA
jgi:MFS family permease